MGVTRRAMHPGAGRRQQAGVDRLLHERVAEVPDPGCAAAITAHPRLTHQQAVLFKSREHGAPVAWAKDAAQQRCRFEAQMAEKARIYGERYPIDDDFLAALAAMPPAAGIALGFDRLAMLATGAPRIEHVLWTPVIEPGGT